MSRKVLFIFIVLSAIFFCISTYSIGQANKKVLRDTLDNALDISYYLNNLNGFLPIVAPITEPAVGYRAAVAGLFFIPKTDSITKKFKMPDVVGSAWMK